MEGVSHEACSLAGRFGLGKLIAFWDDNGISIDGEVEGWFTDDTPARFEAYGWQVIRGVDGHDPVEIQQAIDTARAEMDRPTLICSRTVIGFGSPNKQGTEATHGAPLGEDEVAATRKNLGWEHEPFVIPADIMEAWDAREAGGQRSQTGLRSSKLTAVIMPASRRNSSGGCHGLMPENWDAETSRIIAELQAAGGDVATRKSSQMALNAFGPMLPELIGGSADLAGSNNTIWSGSVDVNDGHRGRKLHLFWRQGIRHDRDLQRPQPARWFYPLQCNVPGVFGLRQKRGTHVRPAAHPEHTRVYA